MTLGADQLLRDHGGPLGVAEALLLGKLTSLEQQFVWEVVGKTLLTH